MCKGKVNYNVPAGTYALEPVSDVLKRLFEQKRCVLGQSIPGFNPYERKACVPDVKVLQQRFVRHGDQPLAVKVENPVRLGRAGPAGTNDVTQHPPSEASSFAELEIVQAPAAATLPVVKGHRIDTGFKVRLSCISQTSEPRAVIVRAYLVDEGVVSGLETWVPPENAQTLGNGVLEQKLEFAQIVDSTGLAVVGLNCNEAQGAVADFEFSKLTFNQPSQMRPRWVVFVTHMEGCTLYAHFMVPTIVMSRKAEQEDKATRLLWGNVPSCPLMVTRCLRRFVNKELESINIKRELSSKDCSALAKRAGFVVDSEESQSATNLKAGFAALQQYMAKTKELLKVIRHDFHRTSPLLICDFHVTRSKAEELLSGKPMGTYLLRFAEEAGVLAISVVCDFGIVQHHRMTTELLSQSSLQEVLSTISSALMLMDVKTQQLFSSDIFTSFLSYLDTQMMANPPAKRSRSMSTPPDLASGTQGNAFQQQQQATGMNALIGMKRSASCPHPWNFGSVPVINQNMPPIVPTSRGLEEPALVLPQFTTVAAGVDRLNSGAMAAAAYGRPPQPNNKVYMYAQQQQPQHWQQYQAQQVGSGAGSGLLVAPQMLHHQQQTASAQTAYNMQQNHWFSGTGANFVSTGSYPPPSAYNMFGNGFYTGQLALGVPAATAPGMPLNPHALGVPPSGSPPNILELSKSRISYETLPTSPLNHESSLGNSPTEVPGMFPNEPSAIDLLL